MLVDTHCHLDFEVFNDDREETLARALDAGVTRILNPAIDLETSRSVVQLAHTYDPVYACVGVHPNEGTKWTPETRSQLKALGQDAKVVAIGEIGIDYYWDRTPAEVQQRIFREQLDLAAELDLPVVIHTRDASSEDRRASMDVLNIVEEWLEELKSNGSPLAERPGVLHSFSAGLSEAEKALELNFMIGITGPVTFKNAPKLQDLVTRLPEERLLVETDAPFLTPHPYRGKRNEPARVRLVAEKIAELKQKPLEIIADITTMNAKRLFNW
ncbi:MAG: TatD family hydrolase [Chloroflexi bacterium]|nr:TatD family hydrolase [Chloroflexota bacterium]